MSELIEVTRKWIAAHELSPESLAVSDDGKQARFKYESNGDSEPYAAYLDLDLDRQWVEFFLYTPSRIPEKRRGTVAELLALINPRIHLGCLDLLMSDGRVRFRCGVDMEGGKLGVKMLENMDAMGCRYLDTNYPAIMATAFADQSPERAFAELTGEAPAESVNPDWVATGDEPAGWDRLPGARCIQQWARDLGQAIVDSTSVGSWELLGHGAVIEHDDMDRAHAMFRQVAVDARMAFVTVPAEAVLDLPLGTVDPFRATAPVIVFLEPGEWMQTIKAEDAGGDNETRIAGFRERLIERMGNFDSGHPVVFATAAYCLGHIDSSLRAIGVFDRRFAVAPLPIDFLGGEFIDRIGRDLCGETLTGAPGKVGKLVAELESDRKRGLAALAMKRLAHREGSKVEFVDLVNFHTRGTVESDEAPFDAEPVRRQTAYHEAGHALVAILDSAGRDIPEYSTIVASSGFKGVVVRSYAYLYALDAQRTYRDFLHEVRISLAGRAAEQILVGPENVSTGAGSDLEGATRKASEAFASYGFAPGMDGPANAGSNLAVVYGNPTPSEYAHVESLVRRFLAEEYSNVLDMLGAYRPLLDAIADRLMADHVVNQDELVALCAAHHLALGAVNCHAAQSLDAGRAAN